MGDDHEQDDTHDIVDHSAHDNRHGESTLESIPVLHAQADDVGHDGEGDQEAAGGADKLVDAAGEVGQHGHAHSAQQQVNERGNGGQLGAQHHSRQRDGEGLHGHGHTQRHGDGDLCHHGDDGGKQARVADIAHRELAVLIHGKKSSSGLVQTTSRLNQKAADRSTCDLHKGLQSVKIC